MLACMLPASCFTLHPGKMPGTQDAKLSVGPIGAIPGPATRASSWAHPVAAALWAHRTKHESGLVRWEKDTVIHCTEGNKTKSSSTWPPHSRWTQPNISISTSQSQSTVFIAFSLESCSSQMLCPYPPALQLDCLERASVSTTRTKPEKYSLLYH